MKFRLFKKKRKEEAGKEKAEEDGLEEKRSDKKGGEAEEAKQMESKHTQESKTAKHKKEEDKRIDAEREKIRAKFEARLANKAKKEKKSLKKEAKSKFDKHVQKDIKRLSGLNGKRVFSQKKFTIRGFAKIINLQDYLDKAGFDIDAKQVAKKIFKINIIICLVLSLAVIIANIIFRKGLSDLLIFLVGFWVTLFFLLLALIWAMFLFYLDMKIFNRTKEVETVFPDFLQLTSSNISAGMPVDKALWYAVRPGFGVLAKEIETVAKNTMAGEDLSSALTKFAQRYNSKTIQRSVSLLLEGMAAGGQMADLLNKIALNIDETKILKKEMAATVTTYVIFITFATILAAPVLFGLATQLLEIIKQVTTSLGTTAKSSSAFFSFSISSDAIKTRDFKIFSYLMLAISSFSSACIVSTIRKGRVKEGLTSIPIFVIVAILIYTFASLIIKGMFGSFF